MNETARQLQPDEPADRPRILQVVPALGDGGVERGTVDVARYLTDHGWQALVASSGGPKEAELEAIGVTHLRLPLAAKNPLVVRANIRRLETLMRRHRVSLVHARSRVPAWSAYYAARRARVPFLTTFHGAYAGSNRWLKHRYNAIMARGDRVIAISDYVAEHVRAHYGVGPDRLRVIPRGVDLQTFDPAAVDTDRIARLAQRWRLEPGAPVVMLPGRVTRIKGHAVLLRAIARLRRRRFVCLLVGDTEPGRGYAGEVERLIGSMGLGGTVAMVGGCSDMPAALALADVVVAPAVGPEAFGRVALEAQAMGKPVIVSDIGGLSETVMPAATGWLVPPGDVEALADALELALGMPEDARERLARRARAFVTRHFAMDEMGRRTVAVYRELIEGALAGARATRAGAPEPDPALSSA